MSMTTLFAALEVSYQTTPSFSPSSLLHSHQLFKRNMHPNTLNSFFLSDNDERT